RVRDKSTAQVFIISMAVIDLFTCMVIIPLTMFVEYTEYDIKYDFLCKLYHFLITSKIPMSAFIMVAIAFDRYFCICHPFARIITLSRARNIVICLAILASFFGVVTSMFYGVYQVVERIDSKRIDEAMGTNFTTKVARVDTTVTLDDRSDKYNKIRELLIATIRVRNFTFNGTGGDYLPTITEVIYVGVCSPSSVIFGSTLFHVYQRTYMAVYPLCLITVMILYLMIYRFMCLRRSKKLQEKLIMCSYVNGDGNYESAHLINEDAEDSRKNNKNKEKSANAGQYAETIVTSNGKSAPTVTVCSPQDGGDTTPLQTPQESRKHGKNLLVESISNSKISTNIPMLNFYNNNSSDNKKNITDGDTSPCGRRHSHFPAQKYQWYKNRDSMKRYKGKSRRHAAPPNYDVDRLREENRSANVRTALMLFTVTLVFMIAFVPAWVMAHRLIPHSPAVFYLYFSYNVANPFIYAFMNHIFKAYMRKMFTCQKLGTPQRRCS
ncbi:unnamed protein product, partial [Candidula unifasciata]